MKDAQKEYNARKDGSKFYLGLIKKLIIPKDSITYYFQLNDEALDSVLTAREYLHSSLSGKLSKIVL
jgi:hypothetical protein